MSSSGLSRLDRFSLYQRPRPILPGRHCSAVNCNPNCNPALSVKAPGWKTPGLLRAVTGGVVPLPLCGPRCVTRCRGLPCLLASQTALTPSAKPPGKPGLHHAHLPLFQRKSHGEPGWPRRCSACGSPACDARRCQRAGTVRGFQPYAREAKAALPSTRRHGTIAASCGRFSRLWLVPVHGEL